MSNRPAERTLETELFGRDVSFDYSETWVGYSMLGLRLVMAWVFLQAGIDKLLEPGWSAQGYLLNAIPESNPLPWLWPMLAEAPLIDVFNVWGPILIGIALVIGGFVRTASFFGALMMLFYWASHLQGGITAGLPIDHGFVVSSHIVYVLLLFGLGAWGAGRIVGIDARLEQTSVVRNNPWLRYLLG